MSNQISELAAQILQSPLISSIADWNKLIKGLVDRKVLTFSQQRMVSPQILKYPITTLQAQAIIIQAKSHPDMVSIVLKIKHLKRMLQEITQLVELWKQYGLTAEEGNELERVLKSIREKIQAILNELERFLNQSKSIDESFIQTVEKLAEESMGKEEGAKGPEEYQDEKYNEIEQYFNRIRVREVIERPRAPVASKAAEQREIQVYVALNKEDYRPVEVTKISKSYSDYKKIQQILNSFDALRQLSFSQYFPNYYGYSDTSLQSTHHYYFTQIIQGISLKDLLSEKTQYHLTESTPIYQYWCREIFFALNDLFSKPTYMPILPIELSNIYVSERGLQVKLKGVRFNRIRRQNDNPQHLEARLLRNYGLLCLQILGLIEPQIEKVQKINLKLLLKALLRCQFQQQKFNQGSSTKRLSFQLCQNYSQLTKQFVVDVNADTIAKNYQDIFRTQK